MLFVKAILLPARFEKNSFWFYGESRTCPRGCRANRQLGLDPKELFRRFGDDLN